MKNSGLVSAGKIYWGLTTRQPLWVILCCLPEKGRKETEEKVEKIKERDREEREKGMKVKKRKNIVHYLECPLNSFQTQGPT